MEAPRRKICSSPEKAPWVPICLKLDSFLLIGFNYAGLQSFWEDDRHPGAPGGLRKVSPGLPLHRIQNKMGLLFWVPGLGWKPRLQPLRPGALLPVPTVSTESLQGHFCSHHGAPTRSEQTLADGAALPVMASDRSGTQTSGQSPCAELKSACFFEKHRKSRHRMGESVCLHPSQTARPRVWAGLSTGSPSEEGPGENMNASVPSALAFGHLPAERLVSSIP